jgi:uroporphyrinogen-III synthase
MADLPKPLTVLLTRGRDQARPLARVLQKKGWRVILNPLLTFQHTDFAPINPLPMAWILTSQQALPALCQLDPQKQRSVFAVGPVTQQGCLDAGFQAFDTGGDASSLLAYIQQKMTPEEGQLIHLSGAHVRVDISHALTAKGYRCERLVVYEALAKPTLGTILKEALEKRHLTHAVFYSPRTAQIFADLLKENELLSVEDVCVLALSKAILEPLNHLPWKERTVCKDPVMALTHEQRSKL